MARIGYDDEVAFGHGLVQFPSTARGANDVISALDDGGWEVLNGVNMLQNVGFFNKNRVDEVMALNTCKGDGKVEVFGFVKVFGVGKQAAGGHFPAGPFLCSSATGVHIIAGETGIIGLDEVLLLLCRNVIAIGFKRIRENVACTVLIEPVQFRFAAHENTSKHQTPHPFRMVLSINQCEG